MRIRTEAEWRNIIKTWENSNVTITEYCKSQKIAHSGFYKWLKRIRGERVQQNPNRVEEKSRAPVQEFIAIDFPSDSKTTSFKPQATISITTSYGARLEIPL